MKNNDSNSNSEEINSENNYKFDNYGIVMADSIEDLLYDKYNIRNHGYKNNNINDNESFSDYSESDNINSDNNSKDNKYNENQTKINNKEFNNNKYKVRNYNENINSEQKYKNSNYNGFKNGKKNNSNENNNEKNKNFNNINQIKVIKGKDLQIINNDINKPKNEEIKIILNLKDKKENYLGMNFNKNNRHNLNNYKNIKKFHLKYPSETYKINYINYNKLVPKEKGIYISKIHTKRSKSSNKKVISLPISSSCHFLKQNKIIKIKNNTPLKAVRNNLYFSTKEIYFNIEHKEKQKSKEKSKEKTKEKTKEKHKKVYIRKIDSEKLKQKKKLTYGQSSKNKRKGDSVCTEIDITKYNNSPNIVIKIFKNPANLSYKKGVIDIERNSSNNIGKSKSCQKIIYINLDDKKKIPLNKSRKKIKKIKNIFSNNRYENKKENTELPLLKNKEIISALNINSKNRLNHNFDLAPLNKRKKFSEKIYRNMRISSKKMCKSEKNIKNKLLSMNINMKNKNINQKNEEKKLGTNNNKKNNSKIDRLIKSSLFPKTNKEINRKNIVIKRQNNIKYSPMNKYSNFTSIEFPAIDSYFI